MILCPNSRWEPRCVLPSASLIRSPTPLPPQRRVLDRVGYYKSLEKVELISGQSIVSAEGKTVVTNKGVKINAEVVILCTVSSALASAVRWQLTLINPGVQSARL